LAQVSTILPIDPKHNFNGLRANLTQPDTPTISKGLLCSWESVRIPEQKWKAASRSHVARARKHGDRERRSNRMAAGRQKLGGDIVAPVLAVLDDLCGVTEAVLSEPELANAATLAFDCSWK
jgi:hypothetical protein